MPIISRSERISQGAHQSKTDLTCQSLFTGCTGTSAAIFSW